MAGLMFALYPVPPSPNGATMGWTLRMNSSKARCWYSISVTNRAAWKRRSPKFQPVKRVLDLPLGALRAVTAGSVRTMFRISSARRLCSEWKTWCTAVRPMFSLTRPSPATKCALSISSS